MAESNGQNKLEIDGKIATQVVVGCEEVIPDVHAVVLALKAKDMEHWVLFQAPPGTAREIGTALLKRADEVETRMGSAL